MPSQLHEVLLQLFRNRPALAPELLRNALHQELPSYTDVRIDSADLSEVQPAEYRADLVLLLLDDVPVFGIVVEVQLSPDDRKQYVWPVYVAGLRARLECPVSLLVITADDACARWAAKPISLGGDSCLVPWVVGPSGVPEVTDEAVALADPELAVLSAMAHGKSTDTEKSIRIAQVAQQVSANLDEDRATLYCDLIFHSLSEAARRAFQTMRMFKYEYQSDFARQYFAQGRTEGREAGREEGRMEGRLEGITQGRVELVLRQLTVRFGELGKDVEARIAAASLAELDEIGERLLTARTLEEAMG
jgi:hypothetical protein